VADVETLRDKVAIVTGASRGIGAVTATALARQGARVVCAARTLNEGDNPLLEGSLTTTVQRIEAGGGAASAVVANLADEDGCRAIVDHARERFGPVDILVNNAAVGFFGSTAALKLSRWNLAMQITVTAPLLLSQLVLPDMIARGAGRIINVSSESAAGPGPGPYADAGLGDTTYGAQKAAIERLTQGLAQELGAHGVGVAAIAPSLLVPTPGALFNQLVTGEDDPRAETPSYMADAICLLATLPCAEMTGRVVYSQQLLLEQGVIDRGAGRGVDQTMVISGYAAAGG
jgi:citronellol/citronellal dehydrogenase